MAALSPKNMKPKSFLEATLYPGIRPFTDAKTPQAPDVPGIPYVDQAVIDRQTADLARRRRGVAANEIAGNAGLGTTMTPVLGGGG